MQPPPRKGAYIKVCKHLHSEQVSKLQAKNQQECDILEDIRNFTKQRSAIEKSYGEALCKISANYQNRKIPCVPDIRLEDGSDAWNVYSVWRTVLDETEKLGKARLAAVEVFQQQISEDAKQTRQTKITLGKRLIDQLQLLQKDVQLQVQELDRCKKSYYDEEHVAHDAREKASAAEEKLKRKKGSIFQSISSLQKNSAKFSARRDACDEKSAGARNDYLLSLAATNAHQKRYYEIEFERILRTMENETYDKVAEYLTLMSRTELLTCSASQSSYTKIKEQAQTVTRGYNLRCYLTFYPMLGTNLQYDLEPCEGDKIDRITVHDESTQTILEAESKKCVTVVQKEMKTIRECNRKIQKLQSAQRPDPDIDSEAKIEDLKMMIRRCEINKDKAEAKLEILREGGIEVEDYTKSVDSDSLGVDLDTSLSRSGSSLSVREEAGTGEAEAGDQENATSSVATNAAQSSSLDTEEAPEMTAEEEARRQESLTWDPINVDWGEDPVSPLPPVTNGPPEDQGTYPKCIVLYNYTAQNPDELSILENEELELLAEGDGDGWVQARNYKGEVGYVPQNYIEMEEGAATTLPAQDYTTAATANAVATEAPPDSAGLANDTEGYPTMQYNIEAAEDYDAGGSEPPPDMPPPPPPVVVSSPPKSDQIPSLSLPVSTDPTSFAEFCLALYDYEATCHEELTFNEGQIIKVLSKKVHDVDDGWWEGEVDGQVGLFPSLVVEECRHNGEPLTPDDGSGASPCTTPPPHTPPEVPGFLLPPEKVIITQPTPEMETKDEEDPSSATTPTQANGNDSDTEKDPQYGELVSSPDVSNQEDSSTKTGASGSDQKPWDQPSKDLGVAQIIITAATPMVEITEDEITTTGEEDSRVEADQELGEVQPEAERAECEGEAVILDKSGAAAATSTASAPASGVQDTTAASGTTTAGGDGKAAVEKPTVKLPKKTLSEDREEKRSEESPSDETSDQSPTPKSPSPSEGPIELDPEKLKTLERIKESNA